MYSLVNTTISIYRGTVTNEFGDVVADISTALYTKIPAYLSEGGATPHDLNEQVPRIMRIYNGLVASNVDIRTHDRIKDELHGDVFWVRYASNKRDVGFVSDIKLNLEKID